MYSHRNQEQIGENGVNRRDKLLIFSGGLITIHSDG